VARLLRLPAAGSTIPLALLIDRTGGCETWLRTFASRRHLVTQQSVRPDGRIEERVGPARLVLEASAVDGALVVRQVGLAVRLGVVWVRVPARFALQATARAAPARDGGVAVCVRITFPGGALVGSYAGIVALGTRP
jgi:hypothetical protein